MSKYKWLGIIAILLVVLNGFLIMHLYKKISGSSDSNHYVAQGQVNNLTTGNTDVKNALDYLEIQSDLSQGFKEYALSDFKSKNTMSIKINKMALSKQGNDIILKANLLNDSASNVNWILVNIQLYNAVGHNIGLVPYTILSSQTGDKPLEPGKEITLNHTFDGESVEEWDGRFSVDVLTKNSDSSQTSSQSNAEPKKKEINEKVSKEDQIESAITDAVSELNGIEIYQRDGRYVVEATYDLEDGPYLKSAAEKVARDFTFAAYATGLPILRTSIIINKPDRIVGLTVTVGSAQANTQPESTWSDSKIGPTIFMDWVKQNSNDDYNNLGNHTVAKYNF
ncbi:hypothetical protein ACFPVX_15875 [Cohnella faecalis]|uniref:Uncharacterized protein n=1 Tax=Cohnella faecalis TaxID=2315694 RepID=A0A398CFQ7_9BACL|nr:hypothetical protein [Cohnella faecalis]RIE01553.1 hypothetical protein D3H35_24700 [Cohnella faecalis]